MKFMYFSIKYHYSDVLLKKKTHLKPFVLLQSHLLLCYGFCDVSVTLSPMFVCLFVFVALRPKSTAMVIAGRSVHLTTLFPGQA